MRVFLTTLILVVAFNVQAGGNYERNTSNSHSSSHSGSLSAAKSASHSKSISQNHIQNKVTSQNQNVAKGGHALGVGYGKGGHATALSKGGHGGHGGHGGAATANSGDSSATGGDASADSQISISEDNPRQAPSVGLVVPPSTADCMKGIGFGGSRSTGSALIGWSWLARDCHAMKQFELLASLGMHQPAANAYCKRPLHSANFASEEECRAMMVQSLIDQSEPDRTAEYEGIIKEKEAALVVLQERFNRLEEEVGGGGKKPPAASY